MTVPPPATNPWLAPEESRPTALDVAEAAADESHSPAELGNIFTTEDTPAPEWPATTFGDIFATPTPEAPTATPEASTNTFGDIFAETPRQDPQGAPEGGFWDIFATEGDADANTADSEEAAPTFGDIFTPQPPTETAPAPFGTPIAPAPLEAPVPAEEVSAAAGLDDIFTPPAPVETTPAPEGLPSLGDLFPQQPLPPATVAPALPGSGGDLLAELTSARRAPEPTPALPTHLPAGDCPACAKVATPEQATVIYRSDTVIAYLDENPAATGHAILIPTTHHSSLADLTTGQMLDLTTTIATLHAALEKSSIPTRNTTTLMATNEHGHLVIDIIPTTAGDTVAVINQRRERDRAELDLIGAEITNNLTR